jgi:hypothetical protein
LRHALPGPPAFTRFSPYNYKLLKKNDPRWSPLNRSTNRYSRHSHRYSRHRDLYDCHPQKNGRFGKKDSRLSNQYSRLAQKHTRSGILYNRHRRKNDRSPRSNDRHSHRYSRHSNQNSPAPKPRNRQVAQCARVDQLRRLRTGPLGPARRRGAGPGQKHGCRSLVEIIC